MAWREEGRKGSKLITDFQEVCWSNCDNASISIFVVAPKEKKTESAAGQNLKSRNLREGSSCQRVGGGDEMIRTNIKHRRIMHNARDIARAGCSSEYKCLSCWRNASSFHFSTAAVVSSSRSSSESQTSLHLSFLLPVFSFSLSPLSLSLLLSRPFVLSLSSLGERQTEVRLNGPDYGLGSISSGTGNMQRLTLAVLSQLSPLRE